MKRLDCGYWEEFETQVGEFAFTDVNGAHYGNVQTSGEFWRVVEVDLPAAGLTPVAARKLADLLMTAAAMAEREEKELAEQDKRIAESEAQHA